MIYRFDDLKKVDAPIKDGKGNVQGTVLMTPDMFCGKGRLFNHNTLKPGCSVGAHKHEGDFEVYYILSGTGIYDDNGTVVDVKQGDVLVCNDGESHMLENTGKEDMHFIALILYA